MKKPQTCVIIFSLVVATAVSLVAPSFGREVMSKLVMKAGQKVWLFHSGTPDVKKVICMDEVIPVYREVKKGSVYDVQEVGKVKVLAPEGEHYFEAEVVSGTVKVGDIATRGAASCLVQPLGGGQSR